MKANEAPEKIYLQPSTIEQLPYQNIVYTKPLADNSIEYIRKDAFIEKACEWLSKHAIKYYFNKDGHYLGTDELVEDFELSMKLWQST